MKYIKILVLLAGVVAGSNMLCNAQGGKKAMVDCYTSKDALKSIVLKSVKDGKTWRLAEGMCLNGDYFGFGCVPTYSGIYVVGDGKFMEYPIYLKGGERLSLYLDQDTVYLTGKKCSRENKILYEWLALSGQTKRIATQIKYMSVDYTVFFPMFEEFLKKARVFRDNLKSGDKSFDTWMKRYIDYDVDYIALSFMYTPRKKFPEKSEYPEFFKHIYATEKLADDMLMELPFGMALLELYTLEQVMANSEPYMFEYFEKYIPDYRLKGEMLLAHSKRISSYADCMAQKEKWGKFLTAEQMARFDEVAASLYKAEEGVKGADFTYPDKDGKMVSLSDFKGKVVVVDVWATWCAPCRKELPHLKKLEEEMKGTDVVFIGVSLDEAKDREKWKKFIVEEQLPGVQLFASGWSHIAKAYKITGIPRFMVFDRDGKIVAIKAPRPSDEALKRLLEAELKK